MCLVPLSEGSSIDLDNCRSGEGVCSDEFVVGRMESDDNDTDFASDTLRAPGEVARVETESAVLLVAASCANKMDALVADTGIGWLTTFFKGSVETLN